LAGHELATELDSSLGFGRRLARTYLEALCTLSEDAKDARVPVSPDTLDGLLAAIPPMRGAEYLTRDALAAAWNEIDAEVRVQRARFEGSLQDFVHGLNPAWNSVGRVTFHLAENKNDDDRPFAFLATYSEGIAETGQARHIPLSRALQTYRSDREALLRLLRPVDEAARRSDFIRDLADTGAVYQALAWTPAEAFAFLKAVPQCTAAGVVTRLPDWWRRSSARPQVTATLGSDRPTRLGLEAVLDFRLSVTLGGAHLSAREQQELLAGEPGLRLIRGHWVDVDPERLRQAVDHFQALEAEARIGGLGFFDGMRLLAGIEGGAGGTAPVEGAADGGDAWTGVRPGPWLAELLSQLARPEQKRDQLGEALRGQLRPYQRTGVAWLRRIALFGLGGCLADDMGLGKTIQVLALMLHLQRERWQEPHLLVVPASLLGNWRQEIERFAPSLRLVVAHRSELSADELRRLAGSRLRDIDVVMTTYGSLTRMGGLGDREFGLVVLDEAQAIKNPATRQARAVKSLRSRARLALTGTPVENRLSDLWSIFDFLCPGLLGSASSFRALSKRLEEGPGFAPLRRVVSPYLLRRLKTDPSVIPDLPAKTEVSVYCGLTRLQAALYQKGVEDLAKALDGLDGIERRGVVLSFLMRFKQICNHPSQWLGDGGFDPDKSAKFMRLRELCEPLAERQEKALVFTQFRELSGPLASFLETVFGQPGLVLHGGTAVKRRKMLVDRFQREDGPPFFVLSLKAGGTGLNLTEASHVIHFDRWWNPAVENQATDRAFRIGQTRNVLVHKFVCRGTVEERIDRLIAEKRSLAEAVVAPGGGQALLTEMESAELLEIVSLDLERAALEAG
jgi:non-specific serine/threonine protein kinase